MLSFFILIIFLSAMALQLTLFTDTAIRQTLSKTDIQNWSLLSYTPFLTLYKTASLLLLDRHLEWAPKVCILKKVHCIGKNLMMVKQLQSLPQIQYKWTSQGDVPLSGGIFRLPVAQSVNMLSDRLGGWGEICYIMSGSSTASD